MVLPTLFFGKEKKKNQNESKSADDGDFCITRVSHLTSIHDCNGKKMQEIQTEMTTTVSELICLVCKNLLDISSCINIFYTSLPKSGELLASFVLGTIRPAVTDLQSSYLCSQCYNLFQMLEQAQSTVTNIQDEIIKIYHSNDNDKIVKNIYQLPIDNCQSLNNETVQLVSTNNCLTGVNQKEFLDNEKITNNEVTVELKNSNEAKSDRIEEPLPQSSKYLCSMCDKKCRTPGELKTHSKTHSSVRPYMCEKCGQAYKHKHALKIHIGMHNGINPFKCKFCNKCFTQKGALMRHLPMHTGETPYQCELCGKRFIHHTSYNMHVLSHTGKKSYQCHICSLSLLSTSHLKRHLRVHSGEKPFSCDLCGKKFAERYNLFAHQKIHDPGEILATNSKNIEHKCDYCSEVFTNKGTLDNHVKQHSIPANEINNEHESQTDWRHLSSVSNKVLQHQKYKDFDAIIRNGFQESFNLETI